MLGNEWENVIVNCYHICKCAEWPPEAIYTSTRDEQVPFTKQILKVP